MKEKVKLRLVGMRRKKSNIRPNLRRQKYLKKLKKDKTMTLAS